MRRLLSIVAGPASNHNGGGSSSDRTASCTSWWGTTPSGERPGPHLEPAREDPADQPRRVDPGDNPFGRIWALRDPQLDRVRVRSRDRTAVGAGQRPGAATTRSTGSCKGGTSRGGRTSLLPTRTTAVRRPGSTPRHVRRHGRTHRRRVLRRMRPGPRVPGRPVRRRRERRAAPPVRPQRRPTRLRRGPFVVLDRPAPVLSLEVAPNGRIYFSDFGAIYRLAPA